MRRTQDTGNNLRFDRCWKLDPEHPVSPLLTLGVAAALRRIRIRTLHQQRQRLHAAGPQAPRSRNVDIIWRSMARTPPSEKTRTRRRRAPSPRPPWR
nr:hypothetical protein Itr_chr14CG27140 [Ipomoea trifida]